MPASLLDLPPEVVALVIERLTTIPSWGTTVRLCKQTKQLCRSPKVSRHLVNLMVRPDGGQRFRFSSPTSTEVVVDHDLPDTGDALHREAVAGSRVAGTGAAGRGSPGRGATVDSVRSSPQRTHAGAVSHSGGRWP